MNLYRRFETSKSVDVLYVCSSERRLLFVEGLGQGHEEERWGVRVHELLASSSQTIVRLQRTYLALVINRLSRSDLATPEPGESSFLNPIFLLVFVWLACGSMVNLRLRGSTFPFMQSCCCTLS